MIIHNPILTGSFTVNGTDVASITGSAASITALNSYTASQNILNGTYTLTSSFAAQTASFTAFTSSVNSFTASQLVLNGTYATTGSNTFAGIQTVNSNLIVTGSITAQTLVVQTVTSSVIYSSGSNVFGNNIANTQTFTGSMNLTGSLTVITTGTEFQVNASGVKFGNVVGDAHSITGSVGISGSLSGSSANFSSTLAINMGTSVADGLFISRTSSTANAMIKLNSASADKWIIGLRNVSDDDFHIYGYTAGADVFKIASTGAATFSSSVSATAITATGLLYSNGGESNTLYTGAFLWTPGSYNFFNQKTDHSLVIGTYNANSPVAAITIAQSGATTFASSVTATGYTFTGTGAVIQSNGSVGNVPQYGLFYNSGGVFYFGKDDGSGGSFGVGAYATVLWNSGAYPIVFATAGAERFRITGTGQSQFKHGQNDLDVITVQNTSSSPYGMNITYTAVSPNNGTNNFLYLADSTGLRFAARSNGGLSNYSGNNINLASDIRLKKDIVPLSSEWNKLKQIEVVNFKYKDSNEETALYGAIAQQIQTIYPELVVVTREATETEPEYYGLREQPFQWLTTKVLQEAMAKIETLEAQINELKNK